MADPPQPQPSPPPKGPCKSTIHTSQRSNLPVAAVQPRRATIGCRRNSRSTSRRRSLNMSAPFRIKPNTSVVALRFHKVASTTFKSVLAADLQPSHMDHESLAAYRRGGLAELRCLGAPAAARVVFVTLFREPASRILSALHFYADFTGYTSRVIRRGSSGVNPLQLRRAQTWVHTTPCYNYTAAEVSRVLTVLSHAPIGESLGAGMLVSEYSHCAEPNLDPSAI